MNTLAVFEIDGVLSCSARARAVMKRALRRLDWDVVVVTARHSTRSRETLAWLADRFGIDRLPKPCCAHHCGRATPTETFGAKLRTLQTLLRQHHAIDRLVCYEHDVTVLSAYDQTIRSRERPRSYSLYCVGSKDPIMLYGSAVQRTEPSEFW